MRITPGMINKDCILCEKSDYIVLYKANCGTQVADPDVYRCTSIGHGRFGQIVKCNSCGLVYINPRRADSDILEDYSKVVDDKYLNEKKYRILTFNKSLELIKRYKIGGRMLDIGCCIGTFLEAARKSGWETYGVEPSRWAAEYARKESGLNVLEGTVGECAKFGTDFDVITIWDAIEHMTDPLEDLRCAAGFLKKDGMLFFSTMNSGSFFTRFMGRRWPWYMDMHLYYFEPKTIEKLLDKAGLKTVTITGYTHVISLDYLFYKLLYSSERLTRISSKILQALGIGRSPINMRLGDFMTVIAKKK